jgi:hypothetical protein
MPGFLLHQGATAICAHGGSGMPASPVARVSVSGQPVATQVAPYSVAGCPLNILGVPVPCVTALWVTAATRVRVNGAPVLLLDSQSVCIPNGTPLTIVATQTRVKGI